MSGDLSNKLQLFVKGLNDKTHTIFIDKTASVEDLLKIISEWNGVPIEEQRVLYTTKQLEKEKNGKKLYLSDYQMANNSNLYVVLRLRGGQDTERSGDEQPPSDQNTPAPETMTTDAPPKQLDDDVELTDQPDMISWDDDPENKRAKMPCGHAIGPESLTAFCRSLLTAGKFTFRCPYVDREKHTYCGHTWEYYIVRKLAVLTTDEQKEFETNITQNYLRKASGIQECPKCMSYCERMNKKDRRVICPMCSKGRRETFEFCWYCLGEWKTSGITKCGNSACSGEDPRLKILRDCSKKNIVGLAGCPAVRACPNCGLLIEHDKACKHMVCPCNQKFCFICLSKASANGSYKCGTYNSHCTIAEVQKSIPGQE